MQLRVNGQEREVDLGDAPTVAALVSILLPAGRPCAVEVNRRIVRAAEHATTRLTQGDEIEVVTLVGGG